MIDPSSSTVSPALVVLPNSSSTFTLYYDPLASYADEVEFSDEEL